jgi:hypothetical protein
MQIATKAGSSMTGLMTQQQLWQLCEYLEGPQGCNFVDDPGSPEGISWDCDGTLRLTRRWLEQHHLPVEPNVAALEACGGWCDCEVVFNVVDSWADYLRQHRD